MKVGSDRPLRSFGQPEATRSRMWPLAWRHSDDQYPGWPHFRSIRPDTKCSWWTRDTAWTSWWSRGKLKGRPACEVKGRELKFTVCNPDWVFKTTSIHHVVIHMCIPLARRQPASWICYSLQVFRILLAEEVNNRHCNRVRLVSTCVSTHTIETG